MESPNLKKAKEYVTIKSVLTTLVAVATLIGGIYSGMSYVIAAEMEPFKQATEQSFRGLQLQILYSTKSSLDFQIESLQNKGNLTNSETIELQSLLRERERVSNLIQTFVAPATEQ